MRLGEDGVIELDLGLSLGGIFRKTDQKSLQREKNDTDLSGDIGRDVKMRRQSELKQSRGSSDGKSTHSRCTGEEPQCKKLKEGKCIDLKLDISQKSEMTTFRDSCACCSSDQSDGVKCGNQLTSPSGGSRVSGSSIVSHPNSCDGDGGSNDAVSSPGKKEEASTESSGETPSAWSQNDSLCLKRLPCVLTAVKGPGGKSISGYLYRCTNSEISIVCVCHGRPYSPAEFVRHAGGKDVSHPMRQITVIL